jgi:hypothetical protein
VRIALCAAPTPTTSWRQFCRESFLVGQREERREGSVVTEEELRRLLLDRQVVCEPAPLVLQKRDRHKTPRRVGSARRGVNNAAARHSRRAVEAAAVDLIDDQLARRGIRLDDSTLSWSSSDGAPLLNRSYGEGCAQSL